MGKKKLYLPNPNETEKETGRATYSSLIDCFFSSIILCNNIIDVDPDLLDNPIIGSDYIEDEDRYEDIYQWYIVNPSVSIDYINEYNYDNDILLYYSDKLDCYILAVTHFGTAWCGVDTGVEFTDDLTEVI